MQYNITYTRQPDQQRLLTGRMHILFVVDLLCKLAKRHEAELGWHHIVLVIVIILSIRQQHASDDE